MFIIMEMEIGRYLFVTIYVFHKFEKYVHSEREGVWRIGNIYCYITPFLLLKSEQAGGGGIEMGMFEQTHFLNDPIIYFYLHFLCSQFLFLFSKH